MAASCFVLLLSMAPLVASLVASGKPASIKEHRKHSKDKDDAENSEVNKKFDELDDAMRNVTYRWKHPQRFRNGTNQSHSANQSGAPANVNLCGKRIPKRAMKFRHMWNGTSTRSRTLNTHLRGKVVEHPGRDSYALPGAGSEQEVAEGGATGTVAGEEPFDTVLKDGYFLVGCYFDVMVTSADKYGNEKDKYKDAASVSIALYDELLDDADKEAMSPKVCFEFCSTLPSMVYFGITEGRKCYCTPYYKPGAGASGDCTAPCEGDTTKMCGSTEGKSSIYEMHLCDE